MTKTSKAQHGATTTPVPGGKSNRTRQSAVFKIADVKRRQRDINDLTAAGATLSWDQATYMPVGGAGARGRQRATLSRLAHEKSVDSTLGKLLDELEPYAASHPDSRCAAGF
jgi:carboxypeptidase Taq